LSRDPIAEAGGLNLYAYVGNYPIGRYDPLGLDWFDDFTDWGGGLGDGLSFGLTGYGRRWLMGDNDPVNRCSGAYTGGQVTAVVVSTAAGGGAGLLRAGANAGRRGFEFSHWIPNRLGGPRSLFNGNYVPTRTHALSDPFRYRFMPKTWKNKNPMPDFLAQQSMRVPDVYMFAPVGGGIGFAGVAANQALNPGGCN
jgi:hypothetical protein